MATEKLTDISFGDSRIELLMSSLKNGQKLSALHLLAALENESEDELERILEQLRQMNVVLDIEDLPRYCANDELAVRLRWEEQLAKQGDILQKLEKTDPLYLYLEEISQIPACGDIRVLAQRLQQDSQNETVQADVLNLSLNRIVELACQYTGHGVLLMDLIQEGSMGLWEHLAEYQGGDIEQFRDDWIQWHLTKAVILQTYAAGIGQKLRRAVEDYRSVDEKLLAELGRNPTVEEVAEGLHVSPQEAAMTARVLESARMLHYVKKPEPEAIPQEENQAVEDTAYFQMRQRVMELLSELPEQDTRILTLRYGLEGGLPMNPQQVGNRMGLTPGEVIERETSALEKLRQHN